MACIGGLLIGLLMLGFLTAVVLSCLSWVFSSLIQAARRQRPRSQFSLADMLCLFVLVQLPLGGIHLLADRDTSRGGLLVIDLILAAIVIAVWWSGVRTLSRAGVSIVWHRCVFLTVVLPGAYVATFAILLLAVALLGTLASGQFVHVAWISAAEVGTVAAMYALRRATQTIVCAAEQKRHRETG